MMKRKECLNGRIKCISFLLAVVILLFSLPAGVWLAEDGGILEDGVYLLDNAYCNDNYASYGKFYLRTNGVATNTFTPTIRASTDTYGALDSDIYRYWYFEHLGNNEYVIRSMANKSQLLTITSSSLTSTIVTLREYSGSYPTNARWIISRGSYGYVLVNKAKSMSLRVNPSNSLSYVSNTQTGDPCAYLVAEIATTAYMNFDCWRLTSCVDMQSVGVEDKNYYYIFNGYSKLYMTFESNVNGQNIYGRSFSESSNRQWKVVAQDDLTYQIENMYNSKVLNVMSDLDLTMSTNYNASNQKFTIERIESGEYQGLYYIRFSSYYLTLTASTLEVSLVASPDVRSVWSLVSVGKGDASLYSFEGTCTKDGIEYILDPTEIEPAFENWAEESGFDSIIRRNSSALSAYNSLLTSEVFVYNGHGGAGELNFRINNNSTAGSILAYDIVTQNGNYSIDSIEDNALSQLRCVLLLGCKNGVSNSNGHNLVDALYSKGAHYVLGTTMFTIPYYANLFTKNFLSEMNAGISVGEAIYNAAREQSYICVDDNGTWQYLDVLPYYDAGDRIQRFNY